MWYNEWGEEFDSEEAARDNIHEHMDAEFYEAELTYIIPYGELLSWAMDQEAFHEHFQDQISQAQNEFFKTYYTKEEDE